MGIEDYLVASAVNGILAQRLVRTLCAACAVEDDADPAEAVRLLGDAAPVPAGRTIRLRRAVGCPACDGSGYRGRTGIYELLVVDDEIRARIPERSSAVLRELARAQGMVTLREDGWRKAARGITSVSEVLRVTREEEAGEPW
jgi:general secretion pathway protein E